MCAISSLAKIGARKSINFIGKALQDKDKGVREAAIFALGKFGGKEAMNYIVIANVIKDEDLQVRCSAVAALGRLGGDKAFQLISRILDEDNITLPEVV